MNHRPAVLPPTRLPLAFSQVREDARVDAAVLSTLPPGAEAVMIASGGDTAAWLVAGGRIGRLHLVDLNPAQLALTRLKLHLLQHVAPLRRREILGHAPLAPALRTALLRTLHRELGLDPECFGPEECVARVGPDFAGRYEFVFAELRALLAPVRGKLEELLALEEPAEQAAAVEPGTALGDALEAAFAEAMHLDRLVAFFGADATRNPRQSFPQHFLAQTRACLTAQPARSNPFLAQLLLGHFHHSQGYPWLAARAAERVPELLWHELPMSAALRRLPAASVDFIQLSNILDWLTPSEAAVTLALAFDALRPDGLVLIRQLNSTLDIPACGTQFHWRREEAATLHVGDASFFYRALHLAEKPAA